LSFDAIMDTGNGATPSGAAGALATIRRGSTTSNGHQVTGIEALDPQLWRLMTSTAASQFCRSAP
jgi:hypothetical protein